MKKTVREEINTIISKNMWNKTMSFEEVTDTILLTIKKRLFHNKYIFYGADDKIMNLSDIQKLLEE